MKTNEVNYEKLIQLIQEWAVGKNIHKPENINRQALKLFEEMGELAGGLAKGNQEAFIDAVGDIQVVLIILCLQSGVDYKEALANVYDIISKRTGKTIDGVFVKDESNN